MKRTFNLLVLVTLLALTFGAAGRNTAQAAPAQKPQFATTSLTAYDQGWYEQGGSHSPSNTNYLVGNAGVTTHNFFVFNLSGLSGTVTSATLHIWQPGVATGDAGDGYLSSDPSETLELYDVTTSIPTLLAGTGGVSAYNDLATGIIFGSIAVPNTSNGSWVDISLNPSALSAIQSALGSDFAIGGNLSTQSGWDYLFGFSNAVFATLDVTIPSDTTPPVLTVPTDITVPQSIPEGAVVNFSATATDETSPANPAVTCVRPSGSTFSLGTTTVNCEATDDAGNIGTKSFTVTVIAAASGNLLKKPDFANAAVFPSPWRAFGFKPPYAAALDCAIFNFGPCSVVFGPGNRAAFQQVNRTGIIGDFYTFSMYSASQNAPIGGDYRIEVSFFNNLNKPVGKYSVYFNPLTHGFELASGNATALGNYNKIIFKFVYNNSSGRAWFDDAFLYFIAGH